jgi:predicted permease
MHMLFQNFRYAIRQIVSEPGLALVTVLIVSFGVGINTSIFSLIHTILAPTLPFDHPDQLLVTSRPVNGPILDAVAEHTEAFNEVFGWYSELLDLNDNGSTTSEQVALISGGAFNGLRTDAALGRLLERMDDQPGGGDNGWKCVLSYGFWKGHFNGNTAVLGKTIKVDGQFVSIVGVAGEDFDGIETGIHPAIYLPLEFDSNIRHRPYSWALTLIARLKDGSSRQMANGYFRNVVERAFHDKTAAGAQSGEEPWRLIPLRQGGGPMGRYLHRQYRLPLIVLQALAVLILLLCCISLAWLLSGRISAKQKEISVRMALGARRWDLWQPILLHHFLLLAIGTAGGLILAFWLSSAAAAKLASPLTRLRITNQFDLPVFAFAGLAAIGSMILATMLSLARTNIVKPAEALKHYGSLGTGNTAFGHLKYLLAFQIAISTALTVGALLLAVTLFRLLNQNFGFDTRHVLSMQLDFTFYGAAGPKIQNTYRQLFTEIQDIKEIQSFSIQSVPLLRDMHTWGTFSIYTSKGIKTEDIDTNKVGPGYFHTLGIKIIKGRDFKQDDRHAVVLNQSAAKEIFSAGDPLGNYVFPIIQGNRATRGDEVIGIVQDSKYENVRNDAPATVYSVYPISDPSTLSPALQLVIQTSHPGVVEQKLHDILKQLAPDAPLNPLIPYQQQITEMTAREQILVELSVLYCLLSLLMTAAGIYGTICQHAKQRTGEIGLRFAVGASRGKIVKLFTWGILLNIFPGLLAGLILGFVLAQSISNLLFGIDASSPWIYCSCLLLILTTTTLAIYAPIRRASMMDPMQALRF